LGLGVWGWGFGVWAQTPKPQSPIPNPQFIELFSLVLKNKFKPNFNYLC